MANISKINQKLTQFGPAPQRTDPANFPTRANAMVAHFLTHLDEQNIMSDEYNTTIDEINTRAADIDNKYDEIVDKHTDFIPKYKDAVTKHGQIETMHTEVENNTSHVETRKGEIDAIKTHIDERKNQIDTDLATAKSFINEQNNVINDTKISEVSTLSSKRLKELIDLKADEATAYKDWNYKTISNTYTAQDNDALFVEASAPFEITLPAKGKVRIIDKAGNFATHNIKLVAGSDKFVLNKDFQRVELFFFNGKWQVVGGYLLVEKNEYSVSKISKNKSQLLGSKVVDRCFVKDNLMIAYHKSSVVGQGNNAVVAIDINTMTDIMPALPSVPSGMYLFAAEASNELFLFARKEDTKEVRLFKFNRSSKNWQQISSSSI